MESYYCKFCNKTMNINSKPKHDYSKSHLYLTNYVIKEYNYHDVDLKIIEEIIFNCSNRYRYNFNEFCIKVKCEINNNLFTTQKETYWKLSNKNIHVINGIERKDLESDKVLEMLIRIIYSGICSFFSNKICSIDGLKIKNLSISLIADYDKMALNHYLQQPCRVLERQLVKNIKRIKSTLKIRQRRHFDFLIKRYEL